MDGFIKFEEALKCCEFFLQHFTEESSARVSEERFMEVIEGVKRAIVSPKCLREHSHPIDLPVFIAVRPDSVLSVFINMRTNKLSCAYVLRKSSGDAVSRLIEDSRSVFSQKYDDTDLRALESIGVRPFDIVKYMRDRLNESSFTVASEMATQEPARA